MGAANPELGKRILDEIALSTNQPLRHDAKTHPFWTSLNLKQIPDEIIIATCSYRKIALFALQLLALNGEEMPPFFTELADDPLKLLKSLKSAFHNGNNESKGKYYVGEFFGVRVLAEATEGEQHTADATQYQEARNKAYWLAAQNLNEGNSNTWYIGVDTLDSTRVELPDGSYLELPALPKPSSWPDFPPDYETNPDGYDQFKRRVIEEKFYEGAILQGLTAGVIINAELDELA